MSINDKDINDAINRMTQEAINKYPGTIDQLKKDWPGIIEDIIEIIIMKNNKKEKEFINGR